MSKILLAAIAVLTGFNGFAQRPTHGCLPNPVNTYCGEGTAAGLQAKTSASGSTLALSNISGGDSVRTLYSEIAPAAGYFTGTNSYNDMGFAERYDFNGSDSSMQVIGVYAQFGGRVNPASANTVALKVWASGPGSTVASTLYYNSFPGVAIDSVVVPFTQLGIGLVKDTLKQFTFPSPTTVLSGAFFVGCTMSYNYASLNGDTIGIMTSLNGHRNTNDYTLRYVRDPDSGDTLAVDTTLNVQNATQWSDGLWYDNYTQDDSIANDLAIFPIVLIGNPTGVSSITAKNLSFFGSYPNPATDDINIRYALSAPASVAIEIMDVNGNVVRSAKESSQGTGEHTIRLNTAGMAAGDYIYTIRTSSGDGIASKLTIIK